MLETVLFIIVLGWIINLVSIVIHMMWLLFITFDTLDTIYGELRSNEYTRVSTYKLTKFSFMFTPFLCVFKVSEYIITYYLIKNDKVTKEFTDVFDRLIKTELKLSNKGK